jgi:hypothetical protein
MIQKYYTNKNTRILCKSKYKIIIQKYNTNKNTVSKCEIKNLW